MNAQHYVGLPPGPGNSPDDYIAPTMSEWYNPTRDTVRIRLFMDEAPLVAPDLAKWEDDPSKRRAFGAFAAQHYKQKVCREIVWAPGQTHRIDSRLDRGIQHVVNGVIVGGLAPQLRKRGDTSVLHPSLDTNEEAKKAALRAAQEAIMGKAVADQALQVAAAHLLREEKPVEPLPVPPAHGEHEPARPARK